MSEALASQRHGIGNLIPAKPGEVRNPKGINQHTKSKERFKQAIEHFAAQQSPVDPELTLDQSLALEVLNAALNGDPHARKEVLKRLWPEVKTTLVGQDPNSDPVQVQAKALELEKLTDDDKQQLLGLAAKLLQEGK